MTRIRFHRGALAASAAIALFATACGGSSDNGAPSQSGSGGSSSKAFVATASVDGSTVLVDAAGHTLYSANVEKGGAIHCIDACTSFWKPLLGSAHQIQSTPSPLDDKLGLLARPDGGKQLTFNGRPLYTFAEERVGQLKGNGFTDDFDGAHFVWLAATTGKAVAPGSTGGSGSPGYSGGGYGY